MLLFHGIYGRMYSLFLLTSALSYVAFLAAVAGGGRRRWALWAVAILATVATHPYGALVLATQVVYVLARARTRAALIAIAIVAVLGSPFWYSDHVLAGRFDVGVGAGGQKLDGPGAVLEYLYRVAGDFTAGFTPVVIAVLVVAVVGARALWLRNRDAALLTACVVLVPTAAFVLARFGQSTSPESRHLIFVLPFFALAAASVIVAASRSAGRFGPLLAGVVVLAIVPAEIAWAWHKTPALFDRENPVRVDARRAAAEWLGATSRPDDVLFAYEPIYLAAWEKHRGAVSRTVVPRADPKLAIETLDETRKPLGRGVWAFDAGDNNNAVKRTSIERRLPFPRSEFEARAFGPFLVIRTRRPTVTVAHYLEDARKAELIGKSLGMGDADINYDTVHRAQVRVIVRSLSRVSS
jgi:hypothetical protein